MRAQRVVTASAGAEWEAGLCGRGGPIEVVARCSNPGELRARIVLDRPDVVVLDAAEMWLDAVLLGAIGAAGAGVVVVGEPDDPRPARLGCGVVVDVSRPDRLVAAISAAAAPAVTGRPGGPGGPGGAVVAVWGPKGGTGRTTVAVNVAWEIALGGLDCVLVDADTTGADVALVLGLEDAPSVATLAHAAGHGRAGPGCLDPYPRPVRGLTVVPGPARPAQWPELRDADLVAMLDVLRRVASVVVVDVGACLEDDDELLAQAWPWRRHQAARAVLGAADVVVATVACDPVSARHAVDADEDLRGLAEPSRVVVVVNKVLDRRGAGDAVASQLERRCGWRGGTYLLPLDTAAFSAAWDGKALAEVHPGSPLRRGVRGVARGLVVGLGRLPGVVAERA